MQIDKSVPRVTVWHHKAHHMAGRVMLQVKTITKGTVLSIWYLTLVIDSLHAHLRVPTLELNEPRCEKTGFLHMRKQRRRSASR